MFHNASEKERFGRLALGITPGASAEKIQELLFILAEENLSLSDILAVSPERRYRLIPPNSDLHPLLARASIAFRTAPELDCSLRSKGAGWFTILDEIYPERILRFMRKSAPFLFFYKGNRALLKRNFYLGIVGTRNPSSAGKEAAYDIAHDIAQKDVVIVSGAATGVDSAAHKGALKKGSTIFFPPCGLFRAKRLHVFEKDFHPDNHLILSEFHPHERGTRSAPISRNRQVAALSDALLIAETGTRGGTLHALRVAREYGKPFLVLDFTPDENPSGNASLISTIGGALPVSDAKNRQAAILKALTKGKALIEKEHDAQTAFF